MIQQIGCSINELDTPFLWVDLDTMENNISYLSGYFKDAGVAWRPHTKGIKVPLIAHKLLENGAIGVTCSKLSEAEVLVSAGIKDILIANQIIGQSKITRLGHLQYRANIIVAIDNFQNARDISKIANEIGVRIGALVEVDIGMHRCGKVPGEPAAELAMQINDLSGIELLGVMGWEGHVVDILDKELKEKTCLRAIESLVNTAEMIRMKGIDAPIVSCGGSGSYMVTAHIPGVTEIQAGGAIFGDLTYVKWGACTECSLFVQSTVISRPTPARAIVDAGFKAMNGKVSTVSMPEVADISGVKLLGLDSEYGYLEIEYERLQLMVNDRVNFIVGYGDATLFLHDYLIGVRGGKVEAVWEIQGRGKLT
ncbi:MAG: DSD1 family PLP-dependent enzyme [Deltaproteobacteria bacterium]|nr:DSD1 family PLP-dependent enzyme [Deltaproteobacteria bacterium]MBW2122614.1 DSD1 family PLP-dependent enzyme [Deltaproteobacteria bacterium]